MSRELLKRALDALVTIEPLIQGWGFTNQNITDAIKAELAKPEDEPVAWIVHNGCATVQVSTKEQAIRLSKNHGDGRVTPLYAHPQRKPLSDEQLEGIFGTDIDFKQMVTFDDLFFLVARAIERAHGIGGDK